MQLLKEVVIMVAGLIATCPWKHTQHHQSNARLVLSPFKKTASRKKTRIRKYIMILFFTGDFSTHHMIGLCLWLVGLPVAGWAGMAQLCCLIYLWCLGWVLPPFLQSLWFVGEGDEAF